METLVDTSYSDKMIAIFQSMTLEEKELYAHSLAHASVCFALYGYCVSDRYMTNLANMTNFFRITQAGVDALCNPASENSLPRDERARIAAAATAFPEEADFRKQHISEAMQLIADINALIDVMHERAMELIEQAWTSRPPKKFSQDHCPWCWSLLDLVHKLRQSGKVQSWQEIVLRV